MAAGKVRGITGPEINADGVQAPLRLNRRSEAIMQDWVMQLVLEGKVFCANIGTLTTSIAFSETTASQLQPAFAISVPSNSKVVIPLHVKITVEATGAAAFEAVIRTSDTAIGAGTSTAVTPVNMNTAKIAKTSGVNVYRTYTGNGTALTNVAEIWRATASQDLDAASVVPDIGYTWSYLTAGYAPVIGGVGAAGTFSVSIANATSSSGFLTVIWAELDPTEV